MSLDEPALAMGTRATGLAVDRGQTLTHRTRRADAVVAQLDAILAGERARVTCPRCGASIRDAASAHYLPGETAGFLRVCR